MSPRTVIPRFLVALTLAPALTSASGLPPVPFPLENPLTEEKRVLGKILFWDEQLSSDNTVACGTCHRPGAGGADPRGLANPGRDAILGTEDDTVGSPGIRRLDVRGRPIAPGQPAQVGTRSTPSNFGSLWAESLFWDGRAGSEFRDPDTGRVMIASGGALENQALGPLLNPVEMSREDRTSADVAHKLLDSTPLALASDLPPDMYAAIQRAPGYPALFAAAFGDPAITAARIAFALATYQRTLVADQTPWDVASAEKPAETPTWLRGQIWFEHHNCHVCHVPPLFTNNQFANVGVQHAFMDPGRALQTGKEEDAGDMKVPSLRNVSLRATFMHTGTFRNLDEVLDVYAAPKAPADPMPTTGERYVMPMPAKARAAIKEFLTVGLTDPRVAAETFPFDRPRLRSERHPEDSQAPARVKNIDADRTGDDVHLRWQAPADDTGVVDYILERNGRVIALPTAERFVDGGRPWWGLYRYRLIARDSAANESPAVAIIVWPTTALLSPVAAVAAAASCLLWLRRRKRRAKGAPAGAADRLPELSD